MQMESDLRKYISIRRMTFLLEWHLINTNFGEEMPIPVPDVLLPVSTVYTGSY